MSNPLAESLYSFVFNKVLTCDYCPEMKKTLKYSNSSCFLSFYDCSVFQQEITQETSGVSSEVSLTMNNPTQRDDKILNSSHSFPFLFLFHLWLFRFPTKYISGDIGSKLWGSFNNEQSWDDKTLNSSLSFFSVPVFSFYDSCVFQQNIS